ncbi:Sulfate-transporting ATPase [Thermodesulfobium narugense DSM 14796]|uniref:Sulfate-transporting ATPase n=1 Tax=Thermodesulfobium narugense DSM 14796 TaxID=747365 RepID=M1E8W9_9BACT|nr:ABC transporter ATP-binding protein [Thermodesulfobium narugense]AEE15190.1 Sulfate-transporting ATPase [Thermodesulfobium narugense DSM 14796]
MSVIQVESLTKYYKNLKALDNVSFSLEEGQILSLIGPNGSGKTTLTKIISGFSQANSGEIKIFGKSVDDFKKVKDKIGLVSQENNLDQDINVLENLIIHSELCGLNAKIAKKRSLALLQKFGLDKYKHEDIRNLSGGTKRKIMLVRALLTNPKLLILDEPTIGLDPSIRRQFWDIIINLKSQNVSTIFTTHYMEEANFLADKIAFINKGKLILSGKPQELIKNVLESFVFEIKGKISTDNYKSYVYEDKTFIFTPSKELLLSKLKLFGIEPSAIRETTLDDLFLYLTGEKI